MTEPGELSELIHLADPGDSRFDDYRSLNDQPFRRRYEGDEIFVVEGFVAIDRLIESGHRVRSVLLAPSRVERFAHCGLLAERGVPVVVAPRDVIGQIVGFDLHRGVVACADRRPAPSLPELLSSTRHIAVLEGLNDNENLGAIARAAKAFGIEGMLLDPRCTDPYSRRTIRVSMGEVLTLPVARVASGAWPAAIGAVAAAGFDVWAMTPAADADDLWTLDGSGRVAVLLGAEGPGLSRGARAAATRQVRIPISPSVDSLNVGHAAAVAFAALSR